MAAPKERGQPQKPAHADASCEPLGQCTRTPCLADPSLRACALTGHARPAMCYLTAADSKSLDTQQARTLRSRSALAPTDSSTSGQRRFDSNSAPLFRSLHLLEPCVPSLGGTYRASGVLQLESACVTLLIVSSVAMLLRRRHLLRLENR